MKKLIAVLLSVLLLTCVAISYYTETPVNERIVCSYMYDSGAPVSENIVGSYMHTP
ncbi:MAG: hypothetical protein WC554_12470 [Clostridia bacterium]